MNAFYQPFYNHKVPNNSLSIQTNNQSPSSLKHSNPNNTLSPKFVMKKLKPVYETPTYKS